MSGLIKWQPFNWLLLLWWLQGRVDEGVDKSKWNIPSNRFWLVLLTLSLQTNSLREGGIGFLPLSVDQTSPSRESMNVNSTVEHIRPAEGGWNRRVTLQNATFSERRCRGSVLTLSLAHKIHLDSCIIENQSLAFNAFADVIDYLRCVWHPKQPINPHFGCDKIPFNFYFNIKMNQKELKKNCGQPSQENTGTILLLLAPLSPSFHFCPSV